MNKEQIAALFSTGQFIKVYDYIAEDAKWEVVEENNFVSKQAIIDNCEQVAQYFQSVTTHFIIKNIISNDSMVVVEGTAEFMSENKRAAFVTACDVYTFNEKNQIESIKSYCIQQK